MPQEQKTVTQAGDNSKFLAKEFADMVRQRLTWRVKKIVLFGSQARGDQRPGSDFDFLIVVNRRDKALRKTILDASVEIMNKHYQLASFIICDEDEWRRKQYFPIGLNILKEGVEI